MPAIPASPPAGLHPAVLFIDAQRNARAAFVQAVNDDFPVLTASDGQEADSLLASHSERIGVAFCGRTLPLRQALLLLSDAKTRYPHIVRILARALPDTEAVMTAVNGCEIHRYLPTITDTATLRGELRSAMCRHRQLRQEHALLAARRRTVTKLASHIAHEMATPLTSIRLLASAMEESWPALVAAFREARARGVLTVDPSRPADPLLDHRAPSTIRAVAERASMLMQLVLVNAREHATDTADFGLFSMRGCVSGALQTYAFANGEAERVHVEGGDFAVWGSEVLMTYVLYNLLKNALHALRVARRGEVRIRLQPDPGNNTLVFRDTGGGIPAEALPQVFEEFFTASGARSGTGLGLPFCRRVMHGLGGHIDCRSREGEFTELRLTFPPAGQRGRTD